MVALRKDVVIKDHRGKPTGKVHTKGERWIVLRGVTSDPVLQFLPPDGEVHFWDDDADSVNEWFEIVTK